MWQNVAQNVCISATQSIKAAFFKSITHINCNYVIEMIFPKSIEIALFHVPLKWTGSTSLNDSFNHSFKRLKPHFPMCHSNELPFNWSTHITLLILNLLCYIKSWKKAPKCMTICNNKMQKNFVDLKRKTIKLNLYYHATCTHDQMNTQNKMNSNLYLTWWTVKLSWR